jgi:hypothetical protein
MIMKKMLMAISATAALGMFGLYACGSDDDNSAEDSGEPGDTNSSDQGGSDSQPLVDPFTTAGYDCTNTDTNLCDSTACAYVPNWQTFATQDCTDRQAYCDATLACVNTYAECLKTGCPPGQALGPETGPSSMDCGTANGTCISDAQTLLQNPK